MADMTGGCLCGRVRYMARDASQRGHICHCRDCQRYTGSAFATGMVFPADAIAIEGELQSFTVAGTSGNAVHRLFCPHCGSGVLVRGDIRKDVVVLQVGTLDDPSGYKPTAEIYTGSALPWVHAADGFPSRAKP